MAIAGLCDAESLFSSVLPTDLLGERALELAVEASHPVYDILFVAAAERTDTCVVTYDRILRRKFPRLTVNPSEVISG